MLIAGFNKSSFVDYPKKISAVVFTPACNFNCWYCHNRQILKTHGLHLVNENDILSFLENSTKLLDAVTITGGEPTLQKDLIEFIKKVKAIGHYLIKLDTNGTNPDTLKYLMDNNLVDYVAMDIKAPFAKYKSITRTPVDIDALKTSMNLLISGDIDYEFRTTFAPTLTEQDILDIAKEIKDSDYYLQQYRPQDDLNPKLSAIKPHTREYIINTADLLERQNSHCKVRGV